MTAFVIFNELSLPLSDNMWESQIRDYIELINLLRDKGVSSVRINQHFKNIDFFTETKSLPAFFGGLPNGDMKTRLRSLLINQSNFYDSPLIKENEGEQLIELTINSEYLLDGRVINGGLACAHIWNTLSVNFNTKEIWANNSISLEKVFVDGTSQEVKVSLLTNLEHCEFHKEEVSRIIKTPENIDELLVFCEFISSIYMYRVSFSHDASEQLVQLTTRSINYLHRIYELIKSIKCTPSEGIGKPEKLKENLTGFSSRRIDDEHRLVYRIISAQDIEISQCLGHY